MNNILNIDQAALVQSVAEHVADRLIDNDDIAQEVRKKIDNRINNLFAERVDKIVADAVDDAVRNGFEREYTRVDQWGEKVGETTTVKKQLDKMIGDYWSARVNAKSGTPTESTYNTVSRAEYVMMAVCAENFSETMRSHALNIAGHLKDGLRKQMAAHMDNILSDLFRVKSLMDQGKVEKPY